DNEVPTASNPTPINVQCIADVPDPDKTVVTDEADNCTANPVVNFVSDVSDGNFNPEVIKRTYSVTDDAGNSIEVTQEINIQDTQFPETPVLPDLIAECSLTVVPPTTTDNCDGEITGTTGLTDLTFDIVGEETIYWVFTDASGKSTEAAQKITITDNAPEPDITGTLPPQTFNGCQISNIAEFTRPTATDQCDGLILGTLAEDFLFPYSVIGSNIIEWEFVDSHGNISVKPQEIRLIPENIDGGDLKGYLTNDGANTASEEVDITACASGSNIIQMNLSNERGTIIQWEKYEVGSGFWEVIENSSDSYSVTFDASTSESTLFRVLIQKGTCNEYSNNFYARAIPPDTAPILDVSLFNTCLNETVSLVARNGFTVQEDVLTGKGGNFQSGQFPDKHNPDMWRIDGAAAASYFTANANNGKPTNWAAKGDGKELGSIYYSSGAPKFGIAQGDYSSSWIKKKQPQVYQTGESTLETPIFSLKNIGTASLEFDQAYNLVDSDYATLELSLDGGNTYSITLQSLSGGDTWDYSNPAKATTPPSSSTNYNFENDNSTFDLTPYVGNSEVRIRWTFHGTSDASAWAIDGISIPTEPILDEIEWTDGLGSPDKPVLSNGRLETTYTFTPEAPGYHEYGATILVDGCRAYDPQGTAMANVYVNYSYAGKDIIRDSQECGMNKIQLNAYDNTITANENSDKGAYPTRPTDCKTCDDPGTGEIGKWTYVTSTNSCENGLFSSSNPTKYPDPTNDPNATFTAGAGTYILTWTVNGCSDDLTITITECNQVDFDGIDDYVDFNDGYDLNGAFSFEIWIKPESTTGTQTIFSKRYLNNMATGYDLKLVGDKISFNWNTSGRIVSSYPITSSRWYHIAVTHTGSLYNLYIDGILIKSEGGGSPNINDTKAILGAMHSNLNDAPSNYFNGWMEELRIWNAALTQDQIHLMMNQRIKKANTNEVEGEEIPVIVNNLSWTNLIGYYRMDNTGCGNLIPHEDIGVTGKLKNITSLQDRTAPLPYIAAKAGNWWDTNTWNEPLVWDPPSSAGITGDTIAWNIVRLNNKLVHNPASTNNSKSIDLLALLDEGGTLDMQGANNTSGNGLTITHYFKLDGVLDLNGESQLIQSEGSEVSGSGYLTRDQQGTASSYNYNYWSSPVVSNTGNQSYTIASVMHDGTEEIPKKLDIGPTGHVTYADGGLSVPRKISGRWLYKFRGDANQYSEWEYLGKDGTLLPGEGYTMKGTSGNANIQDLQNYTFKGFPNNGSLTNPLNIVKDQNYLLGNPYPSAIEARQFILDNLDKSVVTGATNTKNIFNGALYFWDHFGGETHILREYVGGYATINLSGAVQSASSVDERINNNNALGTKKPGQFIPVGQGFFVNTVLDPSLADDLTISGGNINFNNGQRAFATEANTNDSQFLKPIDLIKGPETVKTKDSRYKIRLNFTSALGYQRQILVTADANTTNGFDLGYDALLNDNIPEDMFWLIKENKFVIQGVPNFNLDQKLPIGLKIAEEKEFSIEIGELENLPDIIDIYLRDNSDNTYHDLRKADFKSSLPPGEYHDRYEIVFQDLNSTLVDKEPGEGTIDYYYSLDNREFVISNPELHKIEHINIYNIGGQLVDQHFGIPDIKEIHIPQKKSLSSAVYIVKVYTDAGDYAKKIIIRKD
ncbi:Por secretion system C-terminal sorting domain-containing protein, partial [Salegentibacter holothuriorum]